MSEAKKDVNDTMSERVEPKQITNSLASMSMALLRSILQRRSARKAYVKPFTVSAGNQWMDDSIDDAMQSLHRILSEASGKAKVSMLSGPISQGFLNRYESVNGTPLDRQLRSILEVGGSFDLLVWCTRRPTNEIIPEKFYQQLYWRSANSRQVPWNRFRLRVSGVPPSEELHYFTLIHGENDDWAIRVVEQPATSFSANPVEGENPLVPGYVISGTAAAREKGEELSDTFAETMNSVGVTDPVQTL